ncbi:type I-A CRISPR-associated protein Cas5a [Pyrococcus kukulkanii]|uniref:CRISPR-associated protein Cas5 n=1 Tax=Pyrococcus kukulkanii TaxID=1609559 RepID=A0A127B8M3_9EURY|nr:type I-A CRISPR-associated protein Cas5a [Pyrococcus kukulkanii]AMM53710.1 CRISPR-associated protein Cas5 [Pyrococcus kukulkanii]
MDILLVRLRFPLYSVARRSFQVRTALLLPSPSALKGALARGLILLRGAEGSTLDEVAEKTIRELEEKLVDVRAVSAAPLGPLVKNAFLLKRLRNLESEKNPEKDDAMRREYVFTTELLVAYIFRELSEEEKALYWKAAMLIDTIGDTESLATPVWAEFAELKEKCAPLAFYAPYKNVERLLTRAVKEKGRVKVFTEAMRVSPDYTKSGGLRHAEEVFYLPITEKRHRRIIYYERTTLVPDVNTAVELDGEVFGIWIPGSSSKS